MHFCTFRPTAASPSRKTRRAAKPPLSALLGIALLWLAAFVPAQAERVDWLYTVQVPADSQAVAARREAAGRALLQVLGRVAGVADVASLATGRTLRLAQSQPDQYYNQFSYQRDPQTNSLNVRFEFSPTGIVDLAKRLNLPVWWVDRPRLLLWTLGADGQVEGRSPEPVSGAASREPLPADAPSFAAALAQQARVRGIVLLLPEADSTGQYDVSVRSIAKNDLAGLRAYSSPYTPEAIGAGTVRRSGNGLTGTWSLQLEGVVTRVNANGVDAAQLGQRLADKIANTLAARFAVTGESGVTRMSVAGVATPRDFAQLLNYLNSLEFVDQVQVAKLAGGVLYLDLFSQASVDKLLELFAVSGRLTAADPIGAALGSQNIRPLPNLSQGPGPVSEPTPVAVDLATAWSGPRAP